MAGQLSRQQIERQVARLGPWFHNLDLNGVVTAPEHFLGDYPRVKWRRFEHCLPADLRGKTVLDIGCNAGFYSLEMKRRGAAHVVGIDSDARYLEQARFAAHVLGLEVEFKELSIYHVAELRARFDLVLFMGVLYHLRYPLYALDLLSEHVVGDQLLFQSMLRGSTRVPLLERDYEFEEVEQFEQQGFPRLLFIEQRYASDPTNWWIPNRAAAEAMLRSAGFSILSHPEDEVYLCKKTAARVHPLP